jgi:hypothetical protein
MSRDNTAKFLAGHGNDPIVVAMLNFFSGLVETERRCLETSDDWADYKYRLGKIHGLASGIAAVEGMLRGKEKA